VARPENVRIVRADGTVLPCDLVHLGVDERGVDQWEIANATFRAGLDSVQMDTLPAKTAIRFAATVRIETEEGL
jgi:hypothetical protein